MSSGVVQQTFASSADAIKRDFAHQASLAEAKRLLAEAGYPDGFKVVLTNRSVKLPYIDFGVYLISAWKQIGVEAEHKIEESANWGRFCDPEVDKLFEQQKAELDEQKRMQLVKAMQKRIIEKTWEIMGLWWTRIEVRSAKIHNYEPQPSHWMNRRLEDVWLSKK